MTTETEEMGRVLFLIVPQNKQVLYYLY